MRIGPVGFFVGSLVFLFLAGSFGIARARLASRQQDRRADRGGESQRAATRRHFRGFDEAAYRAQDPGIGGSDL
jgi:hypothetical protein